MKQVVLTIFEFIRKYKLNRLTVSRAIKEYNAYCCAVVDILAEESLLYI